MQHELLELQKETQWHRRLLQSKGAFEMAKGEWRSWFAVVVWLPVALAVATLVGTLAFYSVQFVQSRVCVRVRER